jgi:Dna[CI] antecedent, DciA
LSRTGNKLTALKAQSEDRARVVEQVRAALPARLALTVVSAGLERGRLTIGVGGAQWASRIRYFTDAVRKEVGARLGVPIIGVRIRVLPPGVQ